MASRYSQIAFFSVTVLTLFFVSIVQNCLASNNFIRVQLPKDVSIELPRNWIVLSNNQRFTLDTAVETFLDLTSVAPLHSIFSFAANYYDDSGRVAAITNIRYYPDIDLSQNDSRAATASDLQELDAALEGSLLQGMSASGMKIIEWEGTKKVSIGSLIAFQSEYYRQSVQSSDIFRVRLVRVFANERSFTLTVSYLVSDILILEKITDHIIASLRM